MGNVTSGLCSSPHMVDLESSEDAQSSESTTLTMVSPPGVLPAETLFKENPKRRLRVSG